MEKTLRDEIAIAAMQGLITHYGRFDGAYELLAKTAYEISDEMLKARKEKDND